MITVGGVLLGLALMAVGLSMVWKRYLWELNVGSLYMILDFPSSKWMDWGFLGIVLMLSGFLLATGLFVEFLSLTVGKLYRSLTG